MQSRLSRVYHPINAWEEIKHNMWGSVSDKAAFLEKAIKFTGDHILYGRYMMRVINEWPISCENALTDYSLNRKAWIGHAACALAFKCPENIVRKAWKELTYEQQSLANRQAIAAIGKWEENYRKGKKLCEDVAQQMLFE